MSDQLVAYHCVNAEDLDAVLSEGLLREKTISLGCPDGHICLAETPALAATMLRAGEVPILLEINLRGLDEVSEFVSGEGRVHGDIPPERLRLYAEPVIASREGWVDPAYMPGGNHPACLRRWKR